MSDQNTLLTLKLLATGDLAALTRGKEQTESLKLSVEALKGTLETLGVGLSLGALIEGSKAAIEYGASIKHLSEQAGIATEAFQTLSYAAAGAGLHQEDLSTALNVLQRNMAQAADGATKQNRAIEDLGLNTAELLAMPVEQQIEAIAKAYVSATDKGKAWADVLALLGRNGARFKEVLHELGKDGLEGVHTGLMISDSDIERLDKAEKFWAKIWMNVKAVGAQVVARPSDALRAVIQSAGGNGGSAFAEFEDKGITPKKSGKDAGDAAAAAEAHAAKVKQINEELAATIQASPQMIAAHVALKKALDDEGKAFETPTQAAKRLRAEGQDALDKANELATHKFDAGDQLEAVKLKTEAIKLWTEANAEEVKAAKEKATFDAAEIEMAQRAAQEATKLLPVNQQLIQAKSHQAELQSRLVALDAKSLTYRQDHLKIEGEILAVKHEISALTEKDAAEAVQNQIHAHEIQDRREAIAIAAIEHSYNLTDAQKWDEKRAILTRAVAEQERYIANMQKIADDATKPQGARDKAQHAADGGRNTLANTREQMTAQGADPHSFTQNFSAGLTKLQSQWGTLQQQMASGLTGAISGGLNSVSSHLTKLITGAQSLGQAFRGIAVDIGTTLVQALVDMGVRWVATEAMKLAFGTTAKAADVATSIAAAEATSAAWAVPAMLASVASFGAADIAGAAGLSAAVAAAAAIGVAGFADGGFTGGTEGQPAGIVHGGEFVWSAPAVRAVGVGSLERAHQAAIGGSSGVSAPSRTPGASGNIILAMSDEDVARQQRRHVDARVERISSRMPRARFAT